MLITVFVQVSVLASTKVQMTMSKSFLAPMASQTRSNISILNDAVMALPKKNKMYKQDMLLNT